MIRMTRFSLLLASIGVLSACGAKLLWESRYAEHDPKTVFSLAVDSENNTYVGAGIRTPEFQWGAPTYSGLLLKYSANGVLQWDNDTFANGTVLAVEPLSSSVLAVMVSVLGGTPEVTGELWLVSADNGQVINKIASYGTGAGPAYFQKMKVVGQHLYVASGRHVMGCEFFNQCDSDDPFSGAVDVYDDQGALVQRRILDNAEVLAFDGVSTNGSIAVLLRGQNTELQYWTHDLQTTWNSSAALATSVAMANCGLLALEVTEQGTHVLCGSTVKKFSWAGELVFTTSLNGFLHETYYPFGQVASMQFWGWGGGALSMDANGNVVVAQTRNTMFLPNGGVPAKMGGVDLHVTSSLSADVVVAKLDGNSGSILWSDDIDSPIFGDAERFNASFYSPVGVNVSGDKVLVTYRGVVANYDYCAGVADWELYFSNSCHLESIENRFGNTISYRSTDGKRVGSQYHAMAFPRKVAVDSMGQLIVAGDSESGFLNSAHDATIYGVDLLFGDGVDVVLPAEASDVIVQKVKF